MKYCLTALLFLLFACGSDYPTERIRSDTDIIKDRVLAPDGYHWVVEEDGSFGSFLQNAELENEGAEILDYNQKPISNQSEHIAVLKYDIGNRDLQQCADAVIRLRAEYLFSQKRFDEIGFHFTSGHFFKWNDYKKGIRPRVNSKNEVSFEQKAAEDDSYKSFRKYLDVIFMYAGTISLNNETYKVEKDEEIKTGDILITPGSPGHVVIIAGRAKNKSGETIYLLAQGFTPAQSIHIITNPYDSDINPWYRLHVSSSTVYTARYTFNTANIRSFEMSP